MDIDPSKTMVALVFGQSNAANYARNNYVCQQNVINLYKGRCYKASDPLLGATGNKGCVWTVLGDKIIAAGLFNRVIFIAVGVGNTRVADWAPGGRCHPRLMEGLSWVMARGLKVTHLLWHQGEGDARLGTGKAAYQKAFTAMISDLRNRGVDGSVYPAVATRIRTQISPEIREAQSELANPAEKIYPGPDTDGIDEPGDRFDGTHFTAIGIDKEASAWLAALRAHPY